MRKAGHAFAAAIVDAHGGGEPAYAGACSTNLADRQGFARKKSHSRRRARFGRTHARNHGRFVVDRITVFGDWAFASVHPRNEAGNRIDYRRTRIAKDFDPEQDSDLAGALLRRKDAAWSVVEEAFLPTDVYWEEWAVRYKLPRALFFSE
jgi:hypothetical protein